MALSKLSELTECPECGNDEFYTYELVKGKIAWREKFDPDCGEDAGNEHLFDHLQTTKKFKTVYCGNCQKKIAIDDREK